MCDGCSCPLHFSLPAETSPLEYSVYKPCLVLFGLVDHFQGRLKVKQSSSTHTHTHTHARTHTHLLPLGASHVVLSACVLQKKLEASGEGLPEALLDYIRQNTSCLSSVCDKVGVLCGCSSVSCELHTTVGQHCVCVHAHIRMPVIHASPAVPQHNQVLSLYQEELLTAESFDEMVDVLGMSTMYRLCCSP